MNLIFVEDQWLKWSKMPKLVRHMQCSVYLYINVRMIYSWTYTCFVGWYQGLVDGKVGVFPKNYIRAIGPCNFKKIRSKEIEVLITTYHFDDQAISFYAFM